MKVKIRRANEAVHFEGSGISAVKVQIDGSPRVGGVELGARPMELLLMALGSCAAIDVVTILKKQRQTIDHLEIVVQGKRAEEVTPSPFTSVHLIFNLRGNINDVKATRAVTLSVEKYCSVRATLSKETKVTYEVNFI